MADDLTTQSGTLATVPASSVIATDDVAGRHFQRMKLVDGTADSTTPAVVNSAGSLAIDPKAVCSRIQVASAGLTTASTSYTANDQLGTQLTFANAVRASGGSGVVQSATIIDKTLRIGAVDLLLFSASVTPASDNAAADFSDADMLSYLGRVPFPTPLTGASNYYADVPFLGLGFSVAATSLFGCLVTRTSHSFFAAAGDLVVTLHIAQD